MARKKQKTLVLFPELVAITRKFTDEQFGILIRAAFAYRFSGELYEGDDMAIEVAFQTVANQIDRYLDICETLSNNAKNGNEPQNQAEEEQMEQENTEDSKMQQNTPPILSVPIQSVPIQSNPIPSREGTAARPPRSPKKGAEKHEYGEYKNVLLSDEETEKLRQLLPNMDDMVERLSEYIESSGKKYKSHYATLRAWNRREPKPKKPPALYPEDDLSDIL